MHNQQYQYPNYTPASPLSGFGVPKVLDSGHLELKEGDLIWGSHDGRNAASSRGPKESSRSAILLYLFYTMLDILVCPACLLMLDSTKYVILRKKKRCSSQLHVLRLVSLLATSLNCQVVMLLEVLEAKKG